MADEDDADRILLRIPRSLKQWVAAEAKHHCRSRNGEILSLIKAAQRRAEGQPIKAQSEVA
jgi:hypothetical protein